MTSLWTCEFDFTVSEDKTNDCDSSNPGTENYGKHMTSEEIIEFFAPAQSTVDAVLEWLIESGLNADRLEVSVNKQVNTCQFKYQ